MPSSPGTVSKILWHFTGGPKWNEAEQRQEKELKPIEDAYNALVGIMRSHEIWLGEYRELVRAYRCKSQFYPVLKEVAEGDPAPVILRSSPVCCLADIPIMHLDYHQARYGKIAIGFHRSAVLKHEFSPVFYQLSPSFVLGRIYSLFENIVAGDEAVSALQDELRQLIDENPHLQAMSSENADDRSVDEPTGIERSSALLRFWSSEAKAHAEAFIAFVKTFSEEEFGTIYCEREWRSIKPFEFKDEDVSMIVLPRDGGYFERFVNEGQSIGLPPTVSIVAWEDLVEH